MEKGKWRRNEVGEGGTRVGVCKQDIAQAVKHSLRLSKVKVKVEVRERLCLILQNV